MELYFKNNFKSSDFYLKIPNFYSGEKEAGPQKIYIFLKKGVEQND